MAEPPTKKMKPSKRRVGIVGYGSLGHFLAHKVLESAELELAFVWNRNRGKVEEDDSISKELILDDLDAFASMGAELIVEVSHPSITKSHGAFFLQHADFMCGSPTAFADRDTEATLREAAASRHHGLYIAAGALWGVHDIAKMAQRGTLKGLAISMKFHPRALRLQSPLADRLVGIADETVLYEGIVRDLCPLAPNNVNTMACLCIAGNTIGFDDVQCKLIADPTEDAHEICVEVLGPTKNGDTFRVTSKRHNPAKPGAVTGSATLVSFYSSMLHAGGRGSGVHFC